MQCRVLKASHTPKIEEDSKEKIICYTIFLAGEVEKIYHFESIVQKFNVYKQKYKKGAKARLGSLLKIAEDERTCRELTTIC